MKIVLQRVKQAKVSVDSNVVGQISKGHFLLVGIGKNDNEEKVSLSANKVLQLRVMSDKEDKMNLSIEDVKGEILVVSQFTLYANTSDGRRPSFVDAATPEVARELYEKFVAKLKESGLKVETGEFGAMMEIESIADGPVTILFEV